MALVASNRFRLFTSALSQITNTGTDSNIHNRKGLSHHDRSGPISGRCRQATATFLDYRTGTVIERPFPKLVFDIPLEALVLGHERPVALRPSQKFFRVRSVRDIFVIDANP
jgi:hypothetical protein